MLNARHMEGLHLEPVRQDLASVAFVIPFINYLQYIARIKTIFCV